MLKIKDILSFEEKNNLYEIGKNYYINYLKNLYNNDKVTFIKLFEKNFNQLSKEKFFLERIKINKKIGENNFFIEIRIKIKNLPYYFYILFDGNFNIIKYHLE